MATKSLDDQIRYSLPLLGEEEKKSLLGIVKCFAKLKSQQFKRPTIEEYNKEIDKAMIRVGNGTYYTQKEVE